MKVPMPYRDPATPLTLEQAELRRLVLKQVEADPDSFRMNNWEITYHTASCGTTRCLCGWAEFFAWGEVAREAPSHVHMDAGIELLGLTAGEYHGYFDGRVDYENPGLFYTSDAVALRRMREITPEA